MANDQKESAEGTPFGGFIIGALMLAAAIFMFTKPNAFEHDKPATPWIMGAAGLIGVGMVLMNGLRLYALHVKKLDPKRTDDFAGDVAIGGCFGIVKWGLIAAAAVGGYRFLTGPFAALSEGTRIVTALLAGILITLWVIINILEKMLKKL